MTEAEWLTTTDPEPMLQQLAGCASERKARLLACGCCRRLWDVFTTDKCRLIVEGGERLADGLATNSQRRAWATGHTGDSAVGLSAALGAVSFRVRQDVVSTLLHVADVAASAEVPYWVSPGVKNPAWRARFADEAAVQTDLIRCVFGNPFRPVPLEPDWLTPTVVALAEGAYADRAWDRLPILADALDDAGCTDPDVIGHLRSPGPHARGCWVVDLLLGKT